VSPNQLLDPLRMMQHVQLVQQAHMDLCQALLALHVVKERTLQQEQAHVVYALP
jgi:hypothetical protein